MFCVPDFSVWKYYPDFSWSLFIKAVPLPPKTNYCLTSKFIYMRKKHLLTALLFCLAFVSLNAQSGGNGSGSGNGNGHPTHNPIDLKLKGGSNPGPESLSNGYEIPVSASYTSDTLYIDVEDYSGGIEVEVVNTMTNQTVSQTFDLITGGSGMVEMDISALTHGIYRVDIYLPSCSGEYEGYFEIE